MKATRRTQPMRATAKRRQTAALQRSQKGYGPHPHLQNARRKASKRKRSRRGRARYSSPLQRILHTRKRLG